MKKNLIYSGMIAALMMSATVTTNAQNWTTAGNGGSATQFLGTTAGTTSSFDLRIKTNNLQRMVVKANNGRVGIGASTPTNRLTVFGGTGAADSALSVIYGLVKKTGNYDIIAVEGASQPADGYGIGVSGNGNFIGVNGNSQVFGVRGFGAEGVLGFSIGADTTVANTGTLFGVDGEVDVAHLGVGVYGEATNSYQNIGVWGRSADTAGFLGKTFPNFAGYFQGDLYGWRVWQNSDARLKKDIITLSKSLDKVMQLNPVNYTYTQTNALPLPGGRQVGFVAQELEKYFPDLVRNSLLPTSPTRDARGRLVVGESVETKLVNYMGLIPVLTAALQEEKQNADAQIAELNAKLAALEARLAAFEETSSAKLSSSVSNESSLEQNNPNPFNQSTIINYTVPKNYSSAQIVITSVDGKAVRTYSISGSGKGSVTINANEIAAGTYTYSLNVNGKVVDSKSMVLTK